MILKKNNKTNGRSRFLTNIISKQQNSNLLRLRHELVTFQYRGDYISTPYGENTYIQQTSKQTH